MEIITPVLYVLGAICFLLDTLNTPTRVNLTALGLLCWICVPLYHAIT